MTTQYLTSDATDTITIGAPYTDGNATGVLESYECEGTDNGYAVINTDPAGKLRGRRVIPWTIFSQDWRRV